MLPAALNTRRRTLLRLWGARCVALCMLCFAAPGALAAAQELVAFAGEAIAGRGGPCADEPVPCCPA